MNRVAFVVSLISLTFAACGGSTESVFDAGGKVDQAVMVSPNDASAMTCPSSSGTCAGMIVNGASCGGNSNNQCFLEEDGGTTCSCEDATSTCGISSPPSCLGRAVGSLCQVSDGTDYHCQSKGSSLAGDGCACTL